MSVLRAEDLTAAVEAGIISRAQADALEDLAADRAGRPRASDERFVIVNNFGELFVSIGLVMLAIAANATVVAAAPATIGVGLGLAFALVAWGAAEFFTVRRRMMLPGIVAGLAAVHLLMQAAAASQGMRVLPLLATGTGQILLLGALLAAVLRLRIPFLVLPLGVAVAAVVVSHAGDLVLLAVGLCGLAFLALAVRFDLRDPARLKRAGQFAFWLYVAGSPLTVHPLFFLLLGLRVHGGGSLSPAVVAAIVPVAAVVTLFGLLMDRRSPVISTLGYVAFFVAYVLSQSGGSAGFTAGMTLAVIGLYVVLLGVGWRGVRRAVFRRLPAGPFLDRLPPVSAS